MGERSEEVLDAGTDRRPMDTTVAGRARNAARDRPGGRVESMIRIRGRAADRGATDDSIGSTA
jgi:hypothetical protein